jgi:hypothetical protein
MPKFFRCWGNDGFCQPLPGTAHVEHMWNRMRRNILVFWAGICKTRSLLRLSSVWSDTREGQFIVKNVRIFF